MKVDEFFKILKEMDINLPDLIFSIINNPNIFLTLRDKDFLTIWANSTAINNNEVSIERLKANPCYQVYFGFNKPCPDCAMQKSVESGKPEHSEIHDPEGSSYLMDVYPVKNTNGNIVGYFEVSINITEQRHLAKKLKEEMYKIDYFTSLSHEFKTPLNIIHSTIQILEHKINKNKIDPDYLQNKLNIFKQNSFRLQRLVNNILDINKLEAGKYKQHFVHLNIVKLIKNIVLNAQDYVQVHNKNLYFSSEIDIKIIACDPMDIERIILNLLSNAMKFTDPNDLISVIIEDKEDSIIISVIDTGIGIPEPELKNIFDKFHQVDKSHSRNHEGSGLGLTIVKNLVELHKGTITVKSKSGQGSRFIISLPVITTNLSETETHLDNLKLNLVNTTNIEFSDIYS